MELRNLQLFHDVLPLVGVTAVAASVVLTSCNKNTSDCPPNTASCAACPEVATSCSSECVAVGGFELDPQRHCVMTVPIAGCWPHHDFTEAIILCSVRVSDGAIFSTGPGLHAPAWRSCGFAESQAIDNATGNGPCPSDTASPTVGGPTDAGTDAGTDAASSDSGK
jgi:hypothetical protein